MLRFPNAPRKALSLLLVYTIGASKFSSHLWLEERFDFVDEQMEECHEAERTYEGGPMQIRIEHGFTRLTLTTC